MFKIIIYVAVIVGIFYYWNEISPILHGLLNILDNVAAWVQQLLQENEELIDKAIGSTPSE